MSGWLTAATNAFRKKSEAPPQTFEIRCGCGKIVAGERLRAEQMIVCPACKTSLLIFPASVYPLLRAPLPKKVLKAARATAGDAPVTTARQSETAAPADVARSRRRPVASVAGEKIANVQAPETAPGRLRRSFGPENLDRMRRRLLTPLRMVMLCVVLVIGATVWWISHLRALDRARDVLANVPKIADESLEEGNSAEAARQFARLGKAVDVLGRDDSQSHRWRQLARETAAISDLATSPLHDIVQEAADAETSPEGWSNAFRVNYRDGWVVIDAPVRRSNGGAEGVRYEIDFPLVAGEHRGKLMAEIPALEKVLAEKGAATRVIFAGQLADCRLSSDREPIWQIELRPETGFLWASAETYRLAGLPDDAETLKVLDSQSRLLGISP